MDAAVHRDVIFQAELAPPGRRLLDFRQAFGDETLAAKTRIDCHDEQRINLFQIRFDAGHGRGRD